MIKLQAKRFELNFLLRLSDLESNFTLTLGYLCPALKNPNQDSRLRSLHMSLVWSHCVVSYKDDLSKGINWLQKLSVGDMLKELLILPLTLSDSFWLMPTTVVTGHQNLAVEFCNLWFVTYTRLLLLLFPPLVCMFCNNSQVLLYLIAD